MIKKFSKEAKDDSIQLKNKQTNLTILGKSNLAKDSNILLSELNHCNTYFPKKTIKGKSRSKKNLLKMKIFPCGLGMLNYNNNMGNNNILLNCNQNIFSSTLMSKSPKSASMYHLQKDIQKTIFGLSMKIEKESTIIGLDNDNMKLSTLIKKKLDMDKISNHSNKKVKKEKDKGIRSSSIFGKKLSLDELEENQDNSQIPLKSKSTELMPKINKKKIHRVNTKSKFRILLRKKLVYDSFDSEEDEELEGTFFIPPDDKYIRIFDLLIIFSTLFNIFYTPYFISKIRFFCIPKINFVTYIYYFIDILYIIDLILGFFRAQQNFNFQIINNNIQIIKHYIITQFFLDLIQAIPFFSIFSFLSNDNRHGIYEYYNMTGFQLFLILSLNFKQLKIFKIMDIKKNSVYNEFRQILTKYDLLESLYSFFLYFIFCVFGFYFFISIHIFIGQNSYPNWIIKYNSQNKNLSSLYLISLYYLITTMTTVGYGDIVCASSFREMVFQLILLSAGIAVYSWIVSNIGNYVKNENNASIKFDKDEAILEEIRILYPNMPFKLYKKIYHHLGLRRIRQKQCDSNLLINSLPHSLKHQLLMAIYGQIIKNFKIFRGAHNTDFVIRLLTNFIPLFSKKNAFLIHEGQLIDNIIFVKEGRLALEASIDMREPDKSVKQYLNKNFCDIDEDVVIVSDYESSINASGISETNYKNIYDKAKIELNSVINDKNNTTGLNFSMNESCIVKEIGKWDFGGEVFEDNDFQFINIINISKNESFGDVYMFLSKPSPLSLRVKSKKAELFLLRKYDASDISIRYPNIWAKFFKKSYVNMLSIKALTIHKIKYFWENLGHEIYKKTKTIFERKKTLKKVKTIKMAKTAKIPNTKKSIFSKGSYKITINDKDINSIKDNGNNEFNAHDIYKKRSFQVKDSVRYISFGKESSGYKYTDINMKSGLPPVSIKREKEEETIRINNNNNNKLFNTNCFENKLKLSKFSNKLDFKSSENISDKNDKISSYVSSSHKNNKAKNSRIEYIKKLNRKIRRLKISKKYYKDICKRLCGQDIAKDYPKDNYLSTKNMIKKEFCAEAKKTYLSDKYVYNKQEISISQTSNDSSNSSTQSKTKNNNLYCNLSICSPIRLTFKRKYKNLEKITLGEYSKNYNLRIIIQRFISFYMSISSKIKNEKIFEQKMSTISPPQKSRNIEQKYSSSSCLYSIKKKINISKENQLNESLNKFSSKGTFTKCNDGQYLIILDINKNSLNLFGKNNYSFYKSYESKWKPKRLSSSASKTFSSEDLNLKKQ